MENLAMERLGKCPWCGKDSAFTFQNYGNILHNSEVQVAIDSERRAAMVLPYMFLECEKCHKKCVLAASNAILLKTYI
jgi:hypothetical protein